MKSILICVSFTVSAMSCVWPGYSSLINAHDSSLDAPFLAGCPELLARSGSRRFSERNDRHRQCPICPQGPQGPAGAVGATGPTGATGALNSVFGNFGTKNAFGFLPGGSVIPFDLVNLHTSDVELVTDQTFHIGATAVAIDQPGTYLVTYGLIEGEGNIVLALNNMPQGQTFFFSIFNELTTIISIDAANIAQGQNGAALLEVIAPKNSVFSGALSQQINPNDLLASLAVWQISANPAEP